MREIKHIFVIMTEEVLKVNDDITIHMTNDYGFLKEMKKLM